MRVLLIGAGAIGSAVASASESMPDVERIGVFDVRPEAAAALAARHAKVTAVASLDEGLAACDLVLEAASQEAVAIVGPRALRAGKDLLVVSVGALGDEALLATLDREARAANRRVFVPSGALAGLDGLKGAREARLARVTLTTAKPPAGFGKAAADAKGPITLFEGPAREAVRAFPKNVNVAAALSLSGVGFDATRVRVVADPALALNTHTVEAEGEFGSLRVEVRNVPFPSNPATSHLAALSVIALLRKLASPIQVGT